MFLQFLSLFTQFFFFSYIQSKSFAKPLSAKEEAKQLELLFQGDKQARDILIERNLRLVAHIAKKYENQKDLQEDLISIGTIGLIKAIDSYKPHHKTKLATYASRCIENEILMHLRGNKKKNLDVSLSDIIGTDKDGSEITLEDIIASQEEEFIDQIEKKDNINKLHIFLNNLTDKEKQIIIMRYGLFQSKRYTQKEIGKMMNMSRSYISRIEKKATIKLLKMYLNDKA